MINLAGSYDEVSCTCPRPPQSQAALDEQLRKLVLVANWNGLYDAADWLVKQIQRK